MLTITKPLYPAWIEQTNLTTPSILQTVCISDEVAQQLADFLHREVWEVMDYVDKEKPVAFSHADISSYLYGDGGVCVHINAILEYPMFDLEVREELPLASSQCFNTGIPTRVVSVLRFRTSWRKHPSRDRRVGRLAPFRRARLRPSRGDGSIPV